jgi:cytochrome c peroxidase
MVNCQHEFESSWVLLGSPTNGQTYDKEQFQLGETIYLDSSRPRRVSCDKCKHCGHTTAFHTDVWG